MSRRGVFDCARHAQLRFGWVLCACAAGTRPSFEARSILALNAKRVGAEKLPVEQIGVVHLTLQHHAGRPESSRQRLMHARQHVPYDARMRLRRSSAGAQSSSPPSSGRIVSAMAPCVDVLPWRVQSSRMWRMVRLDTSNGSSDSPGPRCR